MTFKINVQQWTFSNIYCLSEIGLFLCIAFKISKLTRYMTQNSKFFRRYNLINKTRHFSTSKLDSNAPYWLGLTWNIWRCLIYCPYFGLTNVDVTGLYRGFSFCNKKQKENMLLENCLYTNHDKGLVSRWACR